MGGITSYLTSYSADYLTDFDKFKVDLNLLLRVYQKMEEWGFEHNGFANIQTFLKQPITYDLGKSLVPDMLQRLKMLDGPNGYAIFKAMEATYEKDSR